MTTLELQREADRDLVERFLKGMIPYPILLIILAFTTDYPQKHPYLYGSATILVIVTSLVRIALQILGDRIFVLPQRWFIAILGVVTAGSAGAAGVLYGGAIKYYGMQHWAFIVTMMFAVGCASGSTISFTPHFGLLQVYIWTLLGPALCLGVVSGDTGPMFTIATMVLCVFLISQGHSLHNNYWQQLRDRAKESQRTRELQQAKAAAESASMVKSQFLANMSHEIRTPIHAVLGLAELAQDAQTLEEAKEYAETLQTSAEGLLRIINDILDFSKVEAGRLTLEQIPFSLRELTEQVRKVILPQASAKNLTLHCRVADIVHDSLIGDPARLRQVLLNLMGNAVKFTPSGLVEVCVTPTSWDETTGKAGLHFAVRDTGIGIPENQRKVIFEAFGQADGSVTRRFGGTGLGLTISSQLVELMGGRLWVESTPSVGSTFHFTCLMGIGQAAKTIEFPLAVDYDCQPLRVLLAEDNPINQHLATMLLGRRNHSVRVVGTGLEAVQAWETEHFDVILMDNEMPEMSGVEAVEEIRRLEREQGQHRRVPIVALSASAMIGDRERFIGAGMDSYLAKPFRAEELYAVLQQVTTPVAEPTNVLRMRAAG